MTGWEKVTRWAGMGNNGKAEKSGSDAEQGSERQSGDEMVDEFDGVSGVQDGVEAAEMPAAPPEAVDSGEVEKLRAEKDQLVDRLARLQAEFDASGQSGRRPMCVSTRLAMRWSRFWA